MESSWLHAKVVETSINVPLQAGDEVLIHTCDIKVAVKDKEGRWSLRLYDWGSFRAEVLMMYGVFPTLLMQSK